MNSITIAGRLGRDAEQRFTNGGDPVLSFSVADDQYKGEAIWWRCDLWGKRGESLAPFLKKGVIVTVSGSITQSERDGKTYMNVRVSDVALQGGKREGANEQREEQPRGQRTHGQMKRQAFDDMDDDIPF